MAKKLVKTKSSAVDMKLFFSDLLDINHLEQGKISMILIKLAGSGPKIRFSGS
jgi:hypothetical protein